MAFQFALQSVLRLRASLERQEELRLLSAAAAVAKLRGELDRIQTEQVRRKRAVLGELAAGSLGAVLQYSSFCDGASLWAQKNLRVQIEEAERQRLVQLGRYQVARQKREILERLREHQRDAFTVAFNRREQQSVDEAFLIRSYRDSDE